MAKIERYLFKTSLMPQGIQTRTLFDVSNQNFWSRNKKQSQKKKQITNLNQQHQKKWKRTTFDNDEEKEKIFAYHFNQLYWSSLHEAWIKYQSLHFKIFSQVTTIKRYQEQNLKLSIEIWVSMAQSTHWRPSRAMEIMDLFLIQST